MTEDIIYNKFFPYIKYRKDQEDIIKRIEFDIRLNKNVLLIAPSGSGKT